MDVKLQVGQHLAAGFEGYELPADFRQGIHTHKVGNVILFAHNILNKEQTKALCDDIHDTVLKATGQPPFIFIDQEGGVVSRLGEDCTLMPSAMGLAATGQPSLAYEAAHITGLELRALGINFNLAPVMDVNSNPQNPVIGVRSYGASPEQVIPYALAAIGGYREAGILCCAKHFPGHGDTAVDSHLGLPMVDKSLEELEALELKPFRAAIRAGVPAVMSSHILFPKIVKDGLPATMSRAVMTGLLKERLGFSGLVVSDCMMMGAIRDHFGSLEGILSAIRAGVDLAFASHSMELAGEAASSLVSLYESGGLNREEFQASTQSILALKAGLAPAPEGGLNLVGSPAHKQAAAEMFEQSLAAVNLPPEGIPPLGDSPLFISCAPFIPTLASSLRKQEEAFAERLARAFSGTALIMGQNPSPEEIASLTQKAQGHSSVVAATTNGHLRLGQLELVRALAQAHPRVICVALRNPYDLLSLPEGVPGIAAWSSSEPALKALIRLLSGEIPARGSLPL